MLCPKKTDGNNVEIRSATNVKQGQYMKLLINYDRCTSFQVNTPVACWKRERKWEGVQLIHDPKEIAFGPYNARSRIRRLLNFFDYSPFSQVPIGDVKLNTNFK